MNEARLRRTAAELDVPVEDFIVIPFVQEGDLNALYSTCALFVFPSLHEGFGLPVAEAMACGAPAIASNTTSLPEVIGRADAMFDPSDPAGIAACMQNVLKNPALRADLAAWGPVQAGRFTWPSSAARAWDALEQIHTSRLRQEKPRPAGVLQQRPSLAFISPLPPQPSGIADYSRDLLPSLARHYDITLVSETAVEDTRLQAAFPRLDPDSFLAQSGSFDRVVYQIGNSACHRFQTEHLLLECPGVVVLHDAFLSDYLHWLAHDAGRPDDFLALLLRSHGYAALRFDAVHGEDAALARYPCCLPVLLASNAVIQHSRHGVEVLQRHFGAAATSRITVIPMVRADRWRPGRIAARELLGLPDDAFVVCSFGFVTAVKCPSLLADAWRRTGLAGRLVFAGDAAPEFRNCLTDAAAGIDWTGRLAQEQYDAWLAAADVAVQWRTGSRGESSRAVADVLTAGVPLIVNRHGSVAELPADVSLALPDRADAQALAEAIIALHGDAARRACLGAAARFYALRELAPEAIARRYRDAIEHAYATPLPSVQAQLLDQEAAAAAALPGGLRAASRAVGRSFPHTWRAGGRPRLLIDISDLARGDQGPGDRRVVRDIARQALEAPSDVYRAEAVRLHEGRLRQTTAVPLGLLGHAPLELPEVPVDAGAGDVLLCADVNPGMTETEFAELRRLRLDGMRIVLVVHDLMPAPDGGPVGGWYARMFAIADAVVCISRPVAGALMAWLATAGEQRTTPPIGVFHPCADLRAEEVDVSSSVQAAVASAGRRPTVVMVGMLQPRKAHAQALAAFAGHWQAGADIGLTIVGRQGGAMAEFATGLRASPELGERLHWLESCSDAGLQQIYQSGAGLLIASRDEGFGMPIVEAARTGMPVLARDLPVFRDVAGAQARYFRGDRPEDLAAALQAWMAEDFSPSPAGIRLPDWEDSLQQLCATVFGAQWDTIRQP